MRYEDGEQVAVLDWCRMNYVPKTTEKISDYLIAIPNEGKRSGRTGNAMKRRGLTPGASDLFLAIPAGTMHGLWIEMKKSRQHFRGMAEADKAFTLSQREFQQRMAGLKYDAACCYGADEAITKIKTYLGFSHA